MDISSCVLAQGHFAGQSCSEFSAVPASRLLCLRVLAVAPDTVGRNLGYLGVEGQRAGTPVTAEAFCTKNYFRR